MGKSRGWDRKSSGLSRSLMARKSLYVVAACAASLPLVYWLYRRRTSRLAYFSIQLLTKDAVLTVTREIRELYSGLYLQLRHQSRTQRRKFERGSLQYQRCIEDLSASTKRILEKASQSVFVKYGISEALFDDSIAYFEDDHEVAQSAESMCEVLNSTQCPNSLTPTRLREVFTYYLRRLGELDEEDMMLKAALISDEIFERYQFESEEIDVAYQLYRSHVDDLAEQIKQETTDALESDDNT